MRKGAGKIKITRRNLLKAVEKHGIPDWYLEKRCLNLRSGLAGRQQHPSIGTSLHFSPSINSELSATSQWSNKRESPSQAVKERVGFKKNQSSVSIDLRCVQQKNKYRSSSAQKTALLELESLPSPPAEIEALNSVGEDQ